MNTNNVESIDKVIESIKSLVKTERDRRLDIATDHPAYDNQQNLVRALLDAYKNLEYAKYQAAIANIIIEDVDGPAKPSLVDEVWARLEAELNINEATLYDGSGEYNFSFYKGASGKFGGKYFHIQLHQTEGKDEVRLNIAQTTKCGGYIKALVDTHFPDVIID